MISVGVSASEQSLDRASKKFLESFSKYVQLIALDLTAEAKKEAPIDTGFLRASIIMQPVGNLECDVSATASYAGFVHDGTRFIKPNPYMSRARLTIISRWNGKGFALE